MLIALLAVLGVDLGVIVVILLVMLARHRWVSRRPGAFYGAIRITGGEVDGLGARWKRGYGRWVRDVLVWTKGPFLFRNELVAADSRADGVRPAGQGEVRRLGKHPQIITLAAGGDARIAVAVKEDSGKALGPFSATASHDGGQHARGQRVAG